MQAREVVLCHPVRTAIGTYNGSLKATPATELGAAVVRETLRRAGLDPARIGSVVMGNVIQAGNRMNPARQAAVNAGVPVAVPALTVNRVCGSGAQAIASAAQEIWLSNVDTAIAGGMENMDQAPYLVAGGRWGYRMGDAEIYDSMLRDGLNDAFSGEHSGWHTEDLVVRGKISREDQDRWAERSQKRFAAAQTGGASPPRSSAWRLRGARARKSSTPTKRIVPIRLWRCSPSSSRRFATTARSPPAMRQGSTVAPPPWSSRTALSPTRTVSSRLRAWSPTESQQSSPGCSALGRCLRCG